MNRYETKDISFRAVVMTWGGLLVLIAIVHIASLLAIHQFRKSSKFPSEMTRETMNAQSQETPLQTDPIADFNRFRQTENALLSGYGWIDHSSGIFHIPIEAAKRLILEEGLPTRKNRLEEQL